MQPVRQPFQLVDEAMPGANMGMSEQMPHFPQRGHHMPHSGLVLPAPRAVLPGGYMPNMGAPMQPPFYTYQQMWVPVLVQPQLGTISLPSVSSSEPSPLDWQEHFSYEGKKYYYNTRTKQSSWYKPAELMTPLERADATTDWKEYTTPEGRKYYHNKVTEKSKWTIPDELKIARELAEKASGQRPVQDAQTAAGASVGSSYAASSTHDAVAVVSERLDQELRI